MSDAINTANRALISLGVKSPLKVKSYHIAAKLIKVKYMLGRKKDDAILNLPFTKDLWSETALCCSCMFAHSASQRARKTRLYSALLALELTLKQKWFVKA